MDKLSDFIIRTVLTIMHEQYNIQNTDFDLTQPDLTFDAIGLGSVDFIRLNVELEKEFEIKIDLADLEINNYNTVQEYILMLKRKYIDKEHANEGKE